MADKIAREPKYHGALVDTMAVQVKIKQVIVRDLSDGVSESKTKAKVKKLIDAFCERISDESFRARARAALIRSFAKWYREAATVYLALPFLVLSFYRNPPAQAVRAARKRAARLPAPTANRVADLTPHVEYGREWHDADYRKRLKAAYTRYLARFADDEAKYSRRVSLRNLAEVEVRRGEIADMLAGLRARGVRLAWASSHADCSERCSHWQGKLYSLDGTYGTENGTPYQPIENAVNVIDKYGNVNGLFGYNCFDDQTEVFTDKGWRLFRDLDGSEKIYTLSPETRETEWQKPLRYFKQWHDGEMIWLHNKRTDIMCTPNHDLLYFTQKDKRLRFKRAENFTTATFLYAGQEWQGNEPQSVTLGGEEVDAELYCKFMAYYLADGSKHSATSVKIAQRDNDDMFAELRHLPFKTWHDKNKIVIHSKALAAELAQYGTATAKYVPPIIKTFSRRLIREFIEAYLRTDGYTSTTIKANGKISHHKSLFTTSKRMADDLCELALKAGYRPKIDCRQDAGKSIVFRNGEYTINNNLFVIHLNQQVNITHLKKEKVPYRGFIYCLEVPNHTLLVKRNGRIVWCGNCRHRLVPYTPKSRPPRDYSASVMAKERAVDGRQRQMERIIRNWKTRGHVLKSENPDASRKAFEKAREWTDRYEKYSHANGRAFYRERIQVMREEI